MEKNNMKTNAKYLKVRKEEGLFREEVEVNQNFVDNIFKEKTDSSHFEDRKYRLADWYFFEDIQILNIIIEFTNKDKKGKEYLHYAEYSFFNDKSDFERYIK